MNAATRQIVIETSQDVAQQHGLALADLTEDTRRHDISHARLHAMAEIKKRTSLQNRVIAAMFDMDASMVSYACKKNQNAQAEVL